MYMIVLSQSYQCSRLGNHYMDFKADINIHLIPSSMDNRFPPNPHKKQLHLVRRFPMIITFFFCFLITACSQLFPKYLSGCILHPSLRIPQTLSLIHTTGISPDRPLYNLPLLKTFLPFPL